MISHHHRCIFVHVPKTAGQSIERVFLDQLGLSWENRAPLLLRYNDRPELGPRRLAHLKAVDYARCRYVSDEQFRDYFKFAFVRNPWDRAVSLYKYVGSPSEYSFNKFATDILPRQLWASKYWFVQPQTEYLYEDGKLQVDFVGRFENLQEDFAEICTHLGMPPVALPLTNQTSVHSRRLIASKRQFLRAINPLSRAFLNFKGFPITSYRNAYEYYDKESWESVADLYRSDIDAFGYDGV